MGCIKMGLSAAFAWTMIAFIVLGKEQATVDWGWIALIGVLLLFSGYIFRLLAMPFQPVKRHYHSAS
ncbi:hypothetical protein [Magnetococcus sp. PR-3]|uniref:hypothetical protein n=1 Tax=Magnetococcus sp. PR-3 TaxID=3120355 RepID=UPI002FCDF1E0